MYDFLSSAFSPVYRKWRIVSYTGTQSETNPIPARFSAAELCGAQGHTKKSRHKAHSPYLIYSKALCS